MDHKRRKGLVAWLISAFKVDELLRFVEFDA